MLEFFRKQFVTFLLAGLGLAASWYFWSNPFESRVYVDLVNFSTVISADERAENFLVQYKGRPFDLTSENLSIVTFEMGNEGRGVEMVDYDPAAPITLRVRDGDILFATKSGTNSNYLDQRAKLYVEGSDVVFERVLWARDDRVTFLLGVVHEASEEPAFEVFGRLSKQGAVAYSESYFEPRSPLRRIVDFVIAAVPWILVVIGLILLDTIRENWIRRGDRKFLNSVIDEFIGSRSEPLSEEAMSILRHLAAYRCENFFDFMNALENDNDRLAIKLFAEYCRAGKRLSSVQFSGRAQHVLTKLEGAGYFDINQGDFSQGSSDTVYAFLDFLKGKGYVGEGVTNPR